MATLITKKFTLIEVLGATDISLAGVGILAGNAAKIYGPSVTTGASRQSFTPGVGGTLQVLKPGFGYEVVSSSTSPNWDFPGIRVLYGGTAPAPVNVIPTANTNSPAAITLPTSSVALMGAGTDSDGTVTGYAWRQVTGPNNATGLPATTQNVVASNLIAGTYQFGLKTQDNAGAFSNEVFVNALVNPAAAPSGLTVAFSDADYYDSMPVENGTSRRSAFAKVAVTTDATACTITYECTADVFPTVGARIGGVYTAQVPAAEVGTGKVTAVLPLAGSGTRVVELVTGYQQQLSGSQVAYHKILSVNFTGGTTAVKFRPADKADIAVVNGDSISVGASTAFNARDSWHTQLGLLRPGIQFKIEGAGGKQAGNTLDTASKRSALVAAAQAAFGTAATKRYILALGTNDRGANPDTIAGYIGALADAFNAAVPAGIFYVQTLLNYPDGSDNAQRVAVEALAASRPATWFRLIKGDAVTTALPDGVHPNEAGYADLARVYDDQLDYVVARLENNNPLVQLLPAGTWNEFPNAVFSGGNRAVNSTKDGRVLYSTATTFSKLSIPFYTDPIGAFMKLLVDGVAVAPTIGGVQQNTIFTMKTPAGEPDYVAKRLDYDFGVEASHASVELRMEDLVGDVSAMPFDVLLLKTR